MSTRSRPGILGFEEVTEKLEWMPLAARRALDASGAGLSLASWQALDLETRWRFVQWGSEAEVPVTRVREELEALGGVTLREAWHEPTQPTTQLLMLVPEWQGALTAGWSTLGPLERYALEKMAASSRRSEEERGRRVAEACELLLPSNAVTLTHIDSRGAARMVDVEDKPISARVAVASACLVMRATTFELLRDGKTPKGDVLATARIAGIQAAKRTAELIPLCHSLALSGVDLDLQLDGRLPGVRVVARVKTVDRTGVEMEALMAAAVAGLTLYDMLKAVDRGMVLGEVRLEEKRGGRTGDFVRERS